MSTAYAINFLSSRELLNALPANAALLAPDGEIKAINIRWAEFADQNGLRMPRFAIGANYFDICEAVQGPEREFSLTVVQALRDLSQGSQSSVSFQYPCHSPTQQRWFALNATRIGLQNPAPVLTLHEDITALVVHHDRLAKINAELARVAMFVSHDVRDPLHTIMSHVDLIRENVGALLEQSTAQYFEVVAGTARRLSALVTDALNLATLSFGQDVSAEDADLVDMEEVAKEAVDNLAQMVQDYKAKIVVHHLGTAKGNRSYLIQLWQNLISNAIVHSGTSPLVHVGVVWRNGERLFFVRDSGPGVPPEMAYSVFEPFYRGPGPSGGTGLGLAICRHIVEHHKGRIFVESQLGQGSTFYFSIPDRSFGD